MVVEEKRVMLFYLKIKGSSQEMVVTKERLISGEMKQQILRI